MSEPIAAMAFPENRQSARLPLLIRIVGLCLFASFLLLGPFDLGATLAQLRGVPPAVWLLACVCNLAPPLVIALRLKCLLRARHHEVAFPALARDSLRATALNTLTLMGAGDLYRLNRLRSYGVPLTTGGGVMVLDRVFGIAALTALVLAVQVSGIGRALDAARSELGIAAPITGVLIAGCVVLFIVVRRHSDDDAENGLSPRRWVAGDRPLPWLLFGQATALSCAAVGAWVAGVGVLGAGIGISVPPMAYVEAAPLVALATFIPITIGGVGLREAGYVLLLGFYDASPNACIALGLAQYSTFLGVAAVGGVLFAKAE